MTVTVFDERMGQWREFRVVPPDPTFRVRCVPSGIHQFDWRAAGVRVPCACGKYTTADKAANA